MNMRKAEAVSFIERVESENRIEWLTYVKSERHTRDDLVRAAGSHAVYVNLFKTLVSSGAWTVGWDSIFASSSTSQEFLGLLASTTHLLTSTTHLPAALQFAIASCRFDDVRKVVFLTSAVQSPTSEKLRFRATTPRYFLWAERRGYCKDFRVYSLYIEIASSSSRVPWIENFRHHSLTLRNTNLQGIPIIQIIPLANKKKA